MAAHTRAAREVPMDFKQLSYFLTVVDEGTISAAAKKLHMTQPPLSTQMKALEDETGCLLFERGPRSIRLTDAGRIMYERASALLHMSSRLMEELADCRRGSHGTLRLGVVSSVGSTVFCRCFLDFHRAYPDIRFEVSEANTYQLLESLRDGLIELAVVRTPFPAGDFHCVPLKKEALTAAGHKSFFESSDLERSILPLSSLAGRPLIIYRRWEEILTDAFHAQDLEMSVLCKNDDARTTAFWADAGLGIGILPQAAIPLLRHPDSIWKPLDQSLPPSTIAVIHSKHSSLSTVAKTFADYLQSVFCKKSGPPSGCDL